MAPTLRERIGNPLEWSSPAKVLLVTAMIAPPLVGLFLRAKYLIVHPEAEPYIDRATLVYVVSFTNFIVVGLVLCAVVGWLLVRAGRESPLFVYLANLYWWIMLGLGAYLHGAATTPVWMVVPLLAFFVLLLFGMRIALVGLATGVALILGTTVAERLGYLPYAPYFAHWPEVNGRVSDEWIVATLLWPGFATAVAFASYAFILKRWREQSARVAEMSEVLKRMFGRYMSTEVMRTLLDDPSAFELGGARRHVTIVMTDLRGFTPLAERLPPERVIAILNDYLRVMVDVCLRYGGSINEILGDSLLIIFGAPKEMPDHAAAAVACAIEMQNAMGRVNQANAVAGRPDLQMAIAVNTTDVVVGNVGSEKRSKFGVVGSGVNMTSRIESFALGGQVLASQSVVDEVGPWLRIDDRRELHAKGATGPLVVHDIGGIGGAYNLALERNDEELARPGTPLPVRWELLSGKHLQGVRGEARLTAFSRTGIELAPPGELDALDDVRLNLVEGSTHLTRIDVYAKVVARVDGCARLRFTAVPPEVLTYFEGLRAR